MTEVAGRDRSGCDHKPQSLFSEALWGWVLPIIQGCPRSGLSGLCSPWQPLLSHPWPSQCLEEDGMRCWCCPPRGSSVCRLSSVRLPRTPRGRSPCSPSGRAGTQTCLQTRVWSAAQGNQSWGRGAAWLGSGAFMEFERVEDRGGFPGNSWSCRPLLGAQCWQEGLQGRAVPLSLVVFSGSALMGIAFIHALGSLFSGSNTAKTNV